MENYVIFFIPALLALLLIRFLVLPLKLAVKLLLHSVCGFLCLWLLNAASGITGLYLPVNAVTVLIAGFLGLPGIGIILWLETVR